MLSNKIVNSNESTQCNSPSCEAVCDTLCNNIQPCNTTDCQLSYQKLVESTTEVNDTKQTALIAGLTTGFVVLALILVTFGAFVYFRRRRRNNHRTTIENEDQEKVEGSLSPVYVLPPISETSNISSQHQWPIQNDNLDYIDYNHPHSPFIIGAQSLQIPHLDSPDTILNPTPPSVRRSLHIQPTATEELDNALFRSSSVKVTKYDNRPIRHKVLDPYDDDDDELRHNTPKRAVSVKKNPSHVVTQISSVTSQDIRMAQPKLVRINTITRKEGSMTRKKSFRTALQTPQLTLPSQHSFEPSNSTSTLGDGEITVYLDPNSPP